MKRGFYFILALYLVLASIYTFSIPLGEAPDEAPHFSVMVYIVRHKGLPVGPEEHEGFQPPLYYLLGAALSAPFDLSRFAIIGNPDYDLDDPQAPKNLLLHSSDEFFPYAGWAWAWRLVRFFSIMLGGITLWAIYRLGLLLFPCKPRIALAAAAIVAFTPEFLFISSVANNDNLAATFAALTLLYGSSMALNRPEGSNLRADSRRFFLLGILWGLGVLSKASLLALGVFIAGICLLKAWGEAKRKGLARLGLRFAGCFALAMLGMLAVSGWWFVRNIALYGDPLGWELVLRANALRIEPLRLEDYIWLAKGLYRSWWLAWIGISLPGWLYVLLGLIPLAAAAGWLKPPREIPHPALWVVMAFYIIAVIAGLLRWTATVLGTDQARLLYPALPVIALFLAVGLEKWGEKPLMGACGLLFALAIVSPWAFVRPVHAPPPYIESTDSGPFFATFGDLIALRDFDASPGLWRPGGVYDLRLTWKALKDVRESYWLHIKLIDESGQEVWSKDGSPTAGRDTTDRWPPGAIIPSEHRLRLPQNLAPGHYRLLIGLHRFNTWEWLPVYKGGTFIGDVLPLMEIRVE